MAYRRIVIISLLAHPELTVIVLKNRPQARRWIQNSHS